MRGTFQVQPADDLTAVALLFREYADSLGIDLSFQGFEAELAGLPGAYAPPAGALLLARSSSGEALGCVAVRALDSAAVRDLDSVALRARDSAALRARRESGTCEMKRLHTRPNARGAGVGRALALAAIRAATQAGYRTMRLDTLPGMVAAGALYRSLGFETTPAYYDTPLAGTIFMRKTLARP